MTKKTLCIGFTDTFDGCADFFIEWLSPEYNIIRNDEAPDYLIFGDENFGQNNLKYENCIKIFYTGENRRFWNYKCHHGITFDHIDDARHYRLPLYVLNIWHMKKLYGLDEPWHQYPKRIQSHPEHTEFCGFVNSNAGCPERNDFFHTLSAYKKVDSAGPLFNNTGFVLPRNERGVLNKIDFLRSRKFTICYENGSYPGYATEKALEAYYAGSVPLYWGSPTVALDFNPEAIISWHDFLDTGRMIEYIKQLDVNPSFYQAHWEQSLFNRSHPPAVLSQGRFLGWFNKNVYKGSRI